MFTCALLVKRAVTACRDENKFYFNCLLRLFTTGTTNLSELKTHPIIRPYLLTPDAKGQSLPTDGEYIKFLTCVPHCNIYIRKLFTRDSLTLACYRDVFARQSHPVSCVPIFQFWSHDTERHTRQTSIFPGYIFVPDDICTFYVLLTL